MTESKKADGEDVHVDDVLEQLGTFGRYQVTALTLLGVAYMVGAFHSLNYVWAAEDTAYRCKIPNCEGDMTMSSYNESWTVHAAPDNRSSLCYHYPVVKQITTDGCNEGSFDNSTLVPCEAWIYESDNSIVSEFNLACQDWKRAMVGTIRSVGMMVSLLICGPVSDRFGRKVVIYTSGLAAGVMGIVKSYSTGYVMYIALEFIEATVGEAFTSAITILSIEIAHKEKRIHYNSVIGCFYGIGATLLGVIAWKIPYWRDQLRVIYAPAVLIVLFAFLIDESVRWLLSKGRKVEAIELIKKAAKINKIHIENKTLALLHAEADNEDTANAKTAMRPLLETFKSRTMLIRFLICVVWWNTCVMINYGMAIYSVSIAGDKYWNFSLVNFAEIPATLVGTVIWLRHGRRIPLQISYFLSAAFCISLSFIPGSLVWLSTTLYFLGKTVASFAFSTIYIYTSELFPTYTRNSMHALCSALGRFGGILAPQIPLLSVYSETLPTLIFGVCALVAGILTFFTPDTKHSRLPDNVRQAERLQPLEKISDTASRI